jgi:hypothetical protein
VALKQAVGARSLHHHSGFVFFSDAGVLPIWNLRNGFGSDWEVGCQISR